MFCQLYFICFFVHLPKCVQFHQSYWLIKSSSTAPEQTQFKFSPDNDFLLDCDNHVADVRPPAAFQHPAGSGLAVGPLLQRLSGLQPGSAQPAQVHPVQEDDGLQGLLTGW